MWVVVPWICVVMAAGCDALFDLDHINQSSDDGGVDGPAADGNNDAIDAPPPAECTSFAPRQNLQNGIAGSHDPTLSRDRKELFLVRRPGSNYELYRATRADTMIQFGTGTPVNELNDASYDDTDPALTDDGLMIVFKSNRGGSGSKAYQATRTAVGGPFTAPVSLPGLANQPVSGIDLAPDGLTVYIHDGTLLLQATRTARTDPFGSTTVIATNFGSFPSMSPTALVVYYNGSGLVRRKRNTTGQSFDSFGEQSVDAGGADADMISDGTAIVFTAGVSSDFIVIRECL
jgi:WD40 repeat protein